MKSKSNKIWQHFLFEFLSCFLFTVKLQIECTYSLCCYIEYIGLYNTYIYNEYLNKSDLFSRWKLRHIHFLQLETGWCFSSTAVGPWLFLGNLLNWGSKRLNHSAFRKKKDAVTSCTQIHDFQHIGVTKKPKRKRKWMINVLLQIAEYPLYIFFLLFQEIMSINDCHFVVNFSYDNLSLGRRNSSNIRNKRTTRAWIKFTFWQQ